jgi:hypothetical protein
LRLRDGGNGIGLRAERRQKKSRPVCGLRGRYAM